MFGLAWFFGMDDFLVIISFGPGEKPDYDCGEVYIVGNS